MIGILWIARALALVGFLDATYLTATHYSVGSLACGPGGGCDIVTTSEYATVAGVPVALVGLVYYVVVNLIVWTPPSGWSRNLGLVFVAITAIAVGASAVFVYLQAAVIDAWCRYCLLSAGVSAGLFLTALKLHRNPPASEVADG
jgi:uncharacterized membrane protein